jgi:hypothetical protein
MNKTTDESEELRHGLHEFSRMDSEAMAISGIRVELAFDPCLSVNVRVIYLNSIFAHFVNKSK